MQDRSKDIDEPLFYALRKCFGNLNIVMKIFIEI